MENMVRGRYLYVKSFYTLKNLVNNILFSNTKWFFFFVYRDFSLVNSKITIRERTVFGAALATQQKSSL